MRQPAQSWRSSFQLRSWFRSALSRPPAERAFSYFPQNLKHGTPYASRVFAATAGIYGGWRSYPWGTRMALFMACDCCVPHSQGLRPCGPPADISRDMGDWAWRGSSLGAPRASPPRRAHRANAGIAPERSLFLWMAAPCPPIRSSPLYPPGSLSGLPQPGPCPCPPYPRVPPKYPAGGAIAAGIG